MSGDYNQNDKEEEIKNCIYDIIKTLYSAMITVENFKPDESQQHLFEIINDDLLGNFKKLNELKDNLDIEIPIQFLEYIDQGRNPSLYTKEILEYIIEKNEKTKGKIESYEKFADKLEDEIKKQFPEAYQTYLNEKKDL